MLGINGQVIWRIIVCPVGDGVSDWLGFLKVCSRCVVWNMNLSLSDVVNVVWHESTQPYIKRIVQILSGEVLWKNYQQFSSYLLCLAPCKTSVWKAKANSNQTDALMTIQGQKWIVYVLKQLQSETFHHVSASFSTSTFCISVISVETLNKILPEAPQSKPKVLHEAAAFAFIFQITIGFWVNNVKLMAT